MLGSAAAGIDVASAAMTTPETAAGAARDGILVPEHFVPTPRTISPQAQSFLRNKSPVGAMPVPKSRDDTAAWQAYKDAGNSGMVKLTKPYAERYPGDVLRHSLSSSQLYEVTPQNLAPENGERAILYVHGGGFVVGGGEAAINSAMLIAGMAKTRVFAIDYRKVPEFPFPAALDDTVEAYRFILGRHKPKTVAIYGTSSGANLAPAVVLKARDQGLPLPAACVVHSCRSDMGELGDTNYTNFEVDTVLRRPDSALAAYYANGHDTKDPYLSPVFGDFTKGFPPSILTSGTRDLQLSDTVRLHRALVRGGVHADLHVWEAMTHAPFFGAPEEQELYDQQIGFMLRHMAQV